MVFGEPMYFSGDSSDQVVLRDVTNQIMEKIAELSKQEYVPNMYASEAKDAIKKSREDEDQIESDEE
jgi:1-acyl-sn-glycerol-3-phosphate acyltransferase